MPSIASFANRPRQDAVASSAQHSNVENINSTLFLVCLSKHGTQKNPISLMQTVMRWVNQKILVRIGSQVTSAEPVEVSREVAGATIKGTRKGNGIPSSRRKKRGRPKPRTKACSKGSGKRQKHMCLTSPEHTNKTNVLAPRRRSSNVSS